VTDGQGLNLTVQSYLDTLDFGFVACRELVPDLWNILDYCLDEIRVLAEQLGPTTPNQTQTVVAQSTTSTRHRSPPRLSTPHDESRDIDAQPSGSSQSVRPLISMILRSPTDAAVMRKLPPPSVARRCMDERPEGRRVDEHQIGAVKLHRDVGHL
jgi:WS/DGAT C-terminal domain